MRCRQVELNLALRAFTSSAVMPASDSGAMRYTPEAQNRAMKSSAANRPRV